MTKMWTNELWDLNMHKVTDLLCDQSLVARLSIAFFGYRTPMS